MMYTIGEFAAYGRVSARMLRHYDAIGLLKPARVDRFTGYRRYDSSQLSDLLRIVDIRAFGCSLDDAAEVLSSNDRDAATHAVLTRRREALRDAIAEGAARVARIDARLSRLEGAHSVSGITYTSLPAVTVYATSEIAPGSGPEKSRSSSITSCRRFTVRCRNRVSTSRSPGSSGTNRSRAAMTCGSGSRGQPAAIPSRFRPGRS